MNKNTRKSELEKAIREYLNQTEQTRRELVRADRAAQIGNSELYFNTYGAKAFLAACKRLKAFKETYISEFYVDLDCGYVSEFEPEGYHDEESGEWVEPYAENTYKVSVRECVQILFGEIAGYL